MLTLNDRLRPREEEVAAKVIDGEAILINLGNGIYYSMDKVGGLIWEMIEGRHTLGEIVEAVVGRYQVARPQAEADVRTLTEQMLEENLVATAEDGAISASRSDLVDGERLAYDAPKLNIYRDMGDLLALDPPTPGLQNIAWKEPEDEPSK
jgi:hypothetical protein